jgi:hypothetical protein
MKKKYYEKKFKGMSQGQFSLKKFKHRFANLPSTPYTSPIEMR